MHRRLTNRAFTEDQNVRSPVSRRPSLSNKKKKEEKKKRTNKIRGDTSGGV